MIEKLKNLFTTCRQSPGRALSFLKSNLWGVLAFILAFMLGLFFINLTMSRTYALKQLKAAIVNLEEYLNEFNLGMAYDDYSTSSVYTQPLIRFTNFELYSPGKWSLKLPELRIRNSVWNAGRFYIILGDEQTLSLGKDENIIITSENADLQVAANTSGNLELLLAAIKNINVKNYFKIQELNLAGRRVGTHNNGGLAMSVFENHFEAKNITLNGLLDYPLTSGISRIYAKTNFVGSLNPEGSFTAAMENWLHQGGYIGIPNLVVNWNPLLLVGRGEINFNEKLEPSLHLMTSSKGLTKLMDDLQDRDFLERKGVFVAKILLANKSFKLSEEDRYSSVITPLDFSNGKISVENITVRGARQTPRTFTTSTPLKQPYTLQK